MAGLDYDEVGEFLEHHGLTDDEIDEYFEHHGIKGQKWGVRRAEKRAAKGPDRFGNRNNPSVQRRIDRVKRVADGKATLGDKIRAGLFNIAVQDLYTEGLQGGAQATLDRGKRIQRKIVSGRKNTTDILNRLGGVDMRELNYG